MAKTLKQTSLTVENFKKLILPEINNQFSEVRKDVRSEIKSVRSDLTKVVHKVNKLSKIVGETNEKIKFLPTTKKFLASQDKLVGFNSLLN